MKKIALILLCALMAVTTAKANVGPPPYRPGSVMAEIQGAWEVHIEREELRFDLRPLESGQPVPVSATYHLRNPGERRTLELVFAGSKIGTAFTAKLDDKAIESTPEKLDEIPASWKYSPPKEGWKNRERSPMQAWRFRIDLPTGEHQLEVSYSATAEYDYSSDPTRTWKLHYLLAPARGWASFGKLDLQVQTPAGWEVKSNVALKQEEWAASFAELPGDELTFSARLPTPVAYGQMGTAGPVVFCGVLGLGLLAVVFTGVRIGRGPYRVGRALVIGLTAGVVWASLAVGAGYFWAYGSEWTIPAAQRQESYGYGPAFLVIGLVVLAALVFIFAVLAMMVSSAIAQSMSQPSVRR